MGVTLMKMKKPSRNFTFKTVFIHWFKVINEKT